MEIIIASTSQGLGVIQGDGACQVSGIGLSLWWGVPQCGRPIRFSGSFCSVFWVLHCVSWMSSSLEAQTVTRLSTMQETWVRSLGRKIPWRRKRQPTPVLLPRKIPWTEEPGRLQSIGSLGVGHDQETSLSLFTFMHWRRKWQPTPVFFPGESQGFWWAAVYGVAQSQT